MATYWTYLLDPQIMDILGHTMFCTGLFAQEVQIKQ